MFLGAALSAKVTCNAGHEKPWCSSDSVGSGKKAVPLINIMLIVFAFMSGLPFDRLKVNKSIDKL